MHGVALHRRLKLGLGAGIASLADYGRATELRSFVCWQTGYPNPIDSSSEQRLCYYSISL